MVTGAASRQLTAAVSRQLTAAVSLQPSAFRSCWPGLRAVSVAGLVALAVVLVAGCKFTEEVIVPPSDPFLIVHGVLNPRATRQFLTVERSQSDRATPGETGVSGAAVLLTHLDATNCASPTVRLIEANPAEPGVSGSGIYVTESMCALRAGDRVALRIETPDGKVVTGTTRIPGARSVTVTGGPMNSFTTGDPVYSYRFPPGTIPLDRTRDSIRISADPVFARGMQVEAVQTDVDVFTTFRLTADTMGMVIAGDLVDPFDGDGRTVFRAGAYYLLTVALTDTNYYDFTRSGSDPFTGRGFINHLTGAVGVFGSVATTTYKLWVVAPMTDPREGLYSITGPVLGGQSVNLSWELYRDALSHGGDGFSGFLSGRLPGAGVLSTSAGVAMRSGGFEGTVQLAPDPLVPNQDFGTVRFTGQRAPQGQPFDLQVTYWPNNPLGTVRAVQISGPH